MKIWVCKMVASIWWMTDQQRDNAMLVVYLLIIALGAMGIGAGLQHNWIILVIGGLLVTCAGAVLFTARWTLQSRERKQPGWGSLVAQPPETAEGIVSASPSASPACNGVTAPHRSSDQPAA